MGADAISGGLITASSGAVVTGGSFAVGKLYKDATLGLAIAGVGGSSYDFVLLNASGQIVMRNPTGTINALMPGNVTVVGTLGVTGVATFGTASSPGAFIVNGAASSQRDIQWQTSGSARWVWRVDGTESGGNAGANITLQARDDSAAVIGTALGITRATMAATFGGHVLVGASAAVPGTGSLGLIFADGTALSSMASNTAGLYGDDVGGTVNVFGINEANEAYQITAGGAETPRDYACGSFTIQTGRYVIAHGLTFSGSQTVTINGTGSLVLI